MITRRLEYLNLIWMALVSILGIRLYIEPEREYLEKLFNCPYYHSKWASSSEWTFLLGVTILRIISEVRVWNGGFLRRGVCPIFYPLLISRI